MNRRMLRINPDSRLSAVGWPTTPPGALPPAAPSAALHTTNAALPMTPSSPRPPGTPSTLAANANGTQASEISGTIGATRGDGPRTAPRSAAAPMTPAPHAVAFECCTVAVLESGERRCTSFNPSGRAAVVRADVRLFEAFRHRSPIRARRTPSPVWSVPESARGMDRGRAQTVVASGPELPADRAIRSARNRSVRNRRTSRRARAAPPPRGGTPASRLRPAPSRCPAERRGAAPTTAPRPNR